MPLLATSIRSPGADKQVTVLQEYEDLLQVFSPTKATLLPSHREGDCAISLKEGKVPPRGWVENWFQHVYMPLRKLGQAYINEVLKEYLGRSVISYIDNILIYSSSWNQHMLDVQAVLQSLLRNHLYCKAEK
ncbi:hypothetical protein P4O66_020357 [Electrophorus voltai]|uniref:Reverse transcriptase domain-containing protein n=1 Tax=Electrophorus voltai TaxID=2609070 RepID=A0AAD8ZSF5_9TELE|nr:hypothetical protein P4O66_020357 [Electrophorus voltai]